MSSDLDQYEVVHRPRSAMLRRVGGIWGSLARYFFDHIRLDPESATRVRKLPEVGTVVYIMRTRSTLDYLFFNYLYLKHTLPLASFANGIDILFFKGFRLWASNKWQRLTGKEVPQPRAIDQLRTTVDVGDSALLFMKVRALTAERRASPRFIDTLVTLQRHREKPILLVPQHIAWPRKAPSKRRTWLDIAFGDRDASGKLRKFMHFVLSSRTASVQVGEAINLKSVLDEHEGWSDERIARKVRRVLMIHLAREAMAISGPRVKPASMIQREILERRRFRDDLAALARSEGMSPYDAQELCAKHLKEISATMNFSVLSGFCRSLNFLFNRIFQGIEINPEGMRRVKEAARLSRSAPLVLVPSHKSHVDYLVISWLFFTHEFVTPHIAAGANMSFFPAGYLFRRSGAFFLRRSFSGMPFYKLVFKNYLWKLVREGYPVEFFIEGGRSRTGKLLPPKLGMMSMLLEGIKAGEFKDLQFVPINVSYEKVLETGSYKHELTGGQKTDESMTEVVRAGKVLRSRYGRVYINIGEPVRLSEYMGTSPGQTIKEMNTRRYRLFTRRLSYHLMRCIQEATVVSPTALIGTILLSHHRRGMSSVRLRELSGFLIALLERRNARLSASIQHVLAQNGPQIAAADAVSHKDGARARGEALHRLLNEGLVLLKRLVDTVDRGTESIYTVQDRHRIELDYYRNPVLSILAGDCLIATALGAAREPLSLDALAAEVRRLSYWFRLEFIYPTTQSFDESFQAGLNTLERDRFIRIDEDDRVVSSSPLALDFLRGMLLHLVEGYWAAADALRHLFEQPMEESEWIRSARSHAEAEFLQGDVRRAESASTAVLKNALNLFVEEGLVQRNETRHKRKRESYLALGSERTRDDVAFRRDDLGAYLVKHLEQSDKASGHGTHIEIDEGREPSTESRPSEGVTTPPGDETEHYSEAHSDSSNE